MNISRIFIVRPVMTTLLMLSFTIFGLISYFLLPVSNLPEVDFPTIMVQAGLPGASPETMAAAVATPLERQFNTIAGLESMSSSSQQGSTQITLQFDLGRDIDGAAEDVQAAIVAARNLLPSTMPSLPTFKKRNPADRPILYIALSSKTQPLFKVDEFAENVIAPRISMVSGVAQVEVHGSQTYAPHVQVDPRKLSTFGIGIDEVAQAIRSANVNLPTGALHGKDKSYNIQVKNQLLNAADIGPLIVTYRNGAPVRLNELGRVIDDVQTDKVASWYKDSRSVILAVERQPNTNTIEIVNRIRSMIPSFRAMLPGSIELNILHDRSISIRRSIDDVKLTLLITIFLVVLVIFTFLGDLQTTLIASLAVPISIVGTFAFMQALGFTLNNISLMALTLCVGFVVDDAIVVLENIVRRMEIGEPPMIAALRGSKEISFTVISMTLSLVAVFIPLWLMGGVVGRLFFQFGVTITIAILISGFVSLSLTPMLCSRFLTVRDKDKKNVVQKCSDYLLARAIWAYEKALKLAMRFRKTVVAAFLLMVVATGYILYVMPKGFMPSEDTGQIFGTTEAQEGISFEDMVAHQVRIAEIVEKDPSVEGFISTVGAGGPNKSINSGRLIIMLKPREQRKRNAEEIIRDLRKKCSVVPGIKLFMQNPPSIRIGGRMSKALFQLSLSGTDLKELYKTAGRVEEKLRTLPALVDVNTDLELKDLKLDVRIDREKCSQLGVSVATVQDALGNAYGSRQISTIYTSTNQYWVILEALPEYKSDPSMLAWLRVRSDSGNLVPLDSIATVVRSAGTTSVNHDGLFPSVTLSFNIRKDESLSTAVDSVKRVLEAELPENVTYSFGGQAEIFESSTRDLTFLLVLSIAVIYIVLGILYESFIHPITILSGLPSAGLGAVLILLAFQHPLDIYGFLGLILLVGIVKKNAIMMIDYAIERQRKEGVNPEDAIYKACLVRFRPILMTTLAALLGSLPLAIGHGEGSEARQPLGLTIVGGLLVSQLVTLFITPIFYLYLERLKRFVSRFHATREIKEPSV